MLMADDEEFDIVDMAALVSSLAMEAARQPETVSDYCCIFRTPHILLRHHKAGFAPNAFPIGPYHHTNHPKFLPARNLKLRYLNALMTRVGGLHCADPLPRCADKIRAIGGTARRFYASDIGMGTVKFVEVLLLDGCFILELFLRRSETRVRRETEEFVAFMIQYIYQDLIMLENQIPWFVIESLFEEIFPNEKGSTLIDLALKFFSNIFSSSSSSSSSSKIDSSSFSGVRINHILDLLRISLILPLGGGETQLTGGDGTEWQTIPTARALQNSGIKIRRVAASRSILDVRFISSKGVLEMPCFVIQERTEVAFKNLITYEQLHPGCPPYVTCYAMLMDNLINTRDDMDVLSEAGILDNRMTPEDANRLFSTLYHDAFVNRFYYQELCEDVNRYRRRLWPRWRAYFMENYLLKPWAAVSLLVALVLLLLTFLQTLYSVLSYKHSN